jgi:malonate transporter
MNSFINVVIPIFGIILTGYVAGRSGVLGPDSALALNRFVFSFALPPALLLFTARAPVERSSIGLSSLRTWAVRYRWR